MAQTPTLVTGFQSAFHFLGAVLFQWVPATVYTLGTTGTPESVLYPSPPIGPNPGTVSDVVGYLQGVSTPYAYQKLVYDWDTYVALSLFLSFLMGMIILYCVARILQIRRAERLAFATAQDTAPAREIPHSQVRWNRVLADLDSEDEQKMRLAILEADIMLNELLDALGYKGETMAEKMRAVDRANFNTIDIAWEAHRARNAIAHQGSAASLSLRDARRIIGLYEKIFREFRFIE